MEFTEKQKKVLAMIQGDLPDSAQPFADIAKACEVDESEVLELLQNLKDTGVIRRFGATLRHQQAGYGANAMVAWIVGPEKDLDAMAEIIAGRNEVSHCYIRKTAENWPFNLYTMVHAKSREDCKATVAELAKVLDLDKFDVLFSVKELKKTSMRYFDI